MRRVYTALSVLLIIGCMPGIDKTDTVEVGTVLRKLIVDVSHDHPQILAEVSDQGLAIHDELLKALIGATDTQFTLDQDAEQKIRNAFSDVALRVKVRLCIQRTMKEYTVDRDVFNMLRIGIITKFVLNEDETAIDSLIAY